MPGMFGYDQMDDEYGYTSRENRDVENDSVSQIWSELAETADSNHTTTNNETSKTPQVDMNILLVLADVYEGASDTICETLRWMVRWSRFPEVQIMIKSFPNGKSSRITLLSDWFYFDIFDARPSGLPHEFLAEMSSPTMVPARYDSIESSVRDLHSAIESIGLERADELMGNLINISSHNMKITG